MQDSATIVLANTIVFNTQNATLQLNGAFTLNGPVALGTGTNLLTLGGTGNVLVNGALSGAGTLAKAGANTLTLTNNGNNNAGVNVFAGIVNVQANNALGSVGAAIVSNGATIQLQAALGTSLTFTKPLTLIGNGVNNAGALENVYGANTLGGTSLSPVSLPVSATIGVDAGTLTQGTGSVIVGAGGLTKMGGGTLALTG